MLYVWYCSFLQAWNCMLCVLSTSAELYALYGVCKWPGILHGTEQNRMEQSYGTPQV